MFQIKINVIPFNTLTIFSAEFMVEKSVVLMCLKLFMIEWFFIA